MSFQTVAKLFQFKGMILHSATKGQQVATQFYDAGGMKEKNYTGQMVMETKL